MQPSIQYIRDELQLTHSGEEIRDLIKLIFWDLKGYSYTDIILKTGEMLTDAEKIRVKEVVERLKKGEPVQYILGKTEFCGMTLKVNPGVLIPRPETEEMVQWLVSSTIRPPKRILDIGTGSGCIALALKRAFPAAFVSGSDVSDEALSVARENAALNGLELHFFVSDILRWKHYGSWEKQDLIVSNPPYITQVGKKCMVSNVLDFEPHLALFVPDEDPLLFYRNIAEFSLIWLKPGGRLVFEINELYGPEVVRMLRECGFSGIELRKDLRGKERMISAFHLS
jgi:release factor glutamine methyltransferase